MLLMKLSGSDRLDQLRMATGGEGVSESLLKDKEFSTWWPWFDSTSVHKAECIRACPLSDEEITALAHYLTHL
jgi:hypothetical protein